MSWGKPPYFKYDHKNPIHMICGGFAKVPIEFGKPAQCMRCGERFSIAHELGVRIVPL